jgi:hypothetical protein
MGNETSVSPTPEHHRCAKLFHNNWIRQILTLFHDPWAFAMTGIGIGLEAMLLLTR